MNWLTGDNRHPDLARVEVPEDFGGSKDAVEAWLAEQVVTLGETREVLPLNVNDHTNIDPLAELAMMRPGASIIVIEC